MLCISVGPRPDGNLDKDTLSNVEETGEFVVNIVSLSLSNTMFESSKNHPPEADEFERAGLTPAPCEVVKASRVEQAGVSMECVLPLGTDHLVIGRMVRFHVRDELYEDKRPHRRGWPRPSRPPSRRLHEGGDHLRTARRRPIEVVSCSLAGK
jgi:flavin reductase (DIM6/NTAB) family NADH-FMN oxidoreductase RutF